ncbi:MAG: hypothetical protein BWK73_24510 [Thiothrix lacustris]|uniref:Glycosyl transferase family 1 domain-containing protein n=1 Tax=Thiothrix lacustris TaxID=525917 RepID=A0A1Y1QM47_9GAMM|nr:MAG: hypothetical protein BWK73_24510 [Thiothrix lacustris]
MKIAVVAPSSVPFVRGGAENLWWGLVDSLNARADVSVELIKIPSPERNLDEIIHSYIDFARLDLLHFDQVISTKYPAWMINHPNHVIYMQHKLRGLYDTYPQHLSTNIPDKHQFPRELHALHDFLLQPPDSRHYLPEIIQALLTFLAWKAHLPPEWYAFPGAISRSIVHLLDTVGQSSPGVKRHCAISHTVAARVDHFPADTVVEVFYHPTTLRGLHTGQQQYFFTASRLDKPKRIDLIIRAWLAADVTYPLYIAGNGPCEAAWQQLASSNPHIVFLGYVTDQQLAEYYAHALAVIFVPEQEDYGLITLEAMLAGKPVITTNDAGGVTELVQHGVTGWVVAPQVTSLAQALNTCASTPALAARYGEAGKYWAEQISWDKLHAFLVVGLRKKLVVINTFSVYPPVSGGQLRIYHLYRWLARVWNVVLVTLVPASHATESVSIAPGMQEIRIAKSQRYEQREHQLSQQLGISSGDIAALLYPDDLPEWTNTLKIETATADWVVLSHPYGYSALRSVYAGAFCYEAHNVEFDLKQSMLAAQGEIHRYQHALAAVEQAERACVQEAACIISCTTTDLTRLQTHYGVDSSKGVVVANGVDITTIPFTPLAQRLTTAQPQRLTALFMGSLHLPNIQALEYLIELAEQCPNLDLIIAGSVCHAIPRHKQLPANLLLSGVVSDADKQQLLRDCALSLNPMQTGSGSNLKILEAAASGQLIVSTRFGARGGILHAGRDYVAQELDTLPDFLRTLTPAHLHDYREMLVSARQQVQQHADWQILAQQLKTALVNLAHANQKPSSI